MKKVLLFSRDPGGANTIIPLYKPLKENGYKVYLFGKDVALKKYQDNGLDNANNIMDYITNVDAIEIQKFIKNLNPDIIVTGTSADDFCEKYIWQASENLNIPSVAILDQWINYGVRFSKYNVYDFEKYQKHKSLDYLPTKIFMMDDFAIKEAIEDGLPEEKLVATGQPYFQTVQEKAKKISKEEIEFIRANYGIRKEDLFIIFASENLTESYNDPISSIGYSELTILENLLKSLQELNSDKKRNIFCLVRPHPKEKLDKYKKLQKSNLTNNIKLMIDRKFSSAEIILSSDLLCGMSSMFLLESILLKKPTISIQIGLKKDNPFILDRINILKSILDYDNLLESIDFQLNTSYSKSVSFSTVEKPVENVISEINKLI